MSGLNHSTAVNHPVSLAILKAGEGGSVFGYQGSSDVQLRLKELGLVRGTAVFVVRFAPLGDPMELLVRGYHLSIRKKDAAQVLIVRTQ